MKALEPLLLNVNLLHIENGTLTIKANYNGELILVIESLDNPSIEVIIDLHRDEVNEDTKLVTTIQDIPMAKFMFFNGLSYTKELGKLESLPNQYIQDNLAFSFQIWYNDTRV